MGTGVIGSLALSADRGADLVLISSVHEGLLHFVLQRVGDTVAATMPLPLCPGIVSVFPWG